MKFKIIFCLGMLYFSSSLFSQEKYFLKTYRPDVNVNTYSIQKIENQYILMGNTLDTVSGFIDTFIYSLGEFGDSIAFKPYAFDYYLDGYLSSFIGSNNSLFAIGSIISFEPNVQEMIISEIDDDLNFIDTTSYQALNVEKVFKINDNIHLFAGQVRIAPDYDLRPALHFINPYSKESVAYKTYDQWAGQDVYTYGFTKTDDYIFLLPNLNTEPYNFNEPYIIKLDLDGNVISSKTIPKAGHSFLYGTDLLTLKNGNLLGAFMVNNTNQYPDAYLILFDKEGNIISTFDNIVPNTNIITIAETNDKNWLMGTVKYDPDFEQYVDIGLVKSDSLVNILWERYYGGTDDDYIYDMKIEEDGSILVTGRYESGPGVSTYLLKTNCLGLLTEPNAQFSFELPSEENLQIQFSNESENVYENQSDGGHFIWDFGDGKTSNEVNPLHQFCEAGTYEVQLTAVVCQDTAVYSQILQVTGTADCEDVAISDINEKQFTISPNPASNKLYIHSSFTKPIKYEIFDLSGKSYLKGITQNDTSINISGLANGIYTLIFENGEELRFVKK